MTMTDTSIRSRTVTAMFDSREAADRAVQDLELAGIPRQHMRVLEGSGPSSTSSAQNGFWETLKNLFMPEEDRHSYAEGLRRGGFLVSVETEDANYNRVLDILDRDGAADLNEREESWRTEGWTGQGRSAAVTSPDISAMAAATAAPAAGVGLMEPGALSSQSRIGQRDLTVNRSRVRSYSVEAPKATNLAFTSSQIAEHMDVISADGQKIGTVDHLDGPDRIKLAKSTSPDGQHYYVPFTWIDHVDQHVHLKKTLADIKAGE